MTDTEEFRLDGYSFAFPEKGLVVVRMTNSRLISEYGFRVLGVALFGLLVMLLVSGQFGFWGNLVVVVLSLGCLVAIMLPVALSFEIRKGQLTSKSTIWGYGISRTIRFTDTLWIQCKRYSRAGAVGYGASLWAHTTSGSMELMYCSAAEPDKLREIAEAFVRLVKEKTKNKVQLAQKV